MKKYIVLWFMALVFTLTYTLATGESEQDTAKLGKKCNAVSSEESKKIPAKCGSGEENKSKNISPKCGKGKCG